MNSIQPGWLGVPIVIVGVVAIALVVAGVVYGLIPPARRFINGDRPAWWVRDGFLAVLVATLVLFGQSYVLSVSGASDYGQGQEREEAQSLRFSNLDFVRDRSSEEYQARPFRGFDLRGMNLAGLKLMGSEFVEANLAGANLTGTNIRQQKGAVAESGEPPVPAVRTFLQGVNLCNAVLTGADLRSSYLVNANLTGADLSFARLQEAALNGSDFSSATMPSDPSFLEGIYYDENTIWPEGFQPPPSNTGNKFGFLQNQLNNELYGEIVRPQCSS